MDDEGRLTSRQPTTDAIQVNNPEALRTKVMGLEHKSTTKGNPGVQRMYAAMKRSVYWESSTDLYDLVRQSLPYANIGLRERSNTSPMTLLPTEEPPTKGGIETGC